MAGESKDRVTTYYDGIAEAYFKEHPTNPSMGRMFELLEEVDGDAADYFETQYARGALGQTDHEARRRIGDLIILGRGLTGRLTFEGIAKSAHHVPTERIRLERRGHSNNKQPTDPSARRQITATP